MIPKSHPRYESLLLRDKIVKASQKGYLADSGMIAQEKRQHFQQKEQCMLLLQLCFYQKPL